MCPTATHTATGTYASGSAGTGSAAPTAAVVTAAAVVDVAKLMAALIQNPAQLAALRSLLGVQQHPALPPLPASALGITAGVVERGGESTSVFVLFVCMV